MNHINPHKTKEDETIYLANIIEEDLRSQGFDITCPIGQRDFDRYLRESVDGSEAVFNGRIKYSALYSAVKNLF